ncbi:MAG: hypothetical protein RLZZ461_1252 [Planctomycetota bacterium]|jgi:hypothetical protein
MENRRWRMVVVSQTGPLEGSGSGPVVRLEPLQGSEGCESFPRASGRLRGSKTPPAAFVRLSIRDAPSWPEPAPSPPESPRSSPP